MQATIHPQTAALRYWGAQIDQRLATSTLRSRVDRLLRQLEGHERPPGSLWSELDEVWPALWDPDGPGDPPGHRASQRRRLSAIWGDA